MKQEKINKLEKIVHELHKINFGTNGIIHIDPDTMNPQEKDYDFNDYAAEKADKKKEKYKHCIIGYCTECEDNKCHMPADEKYTNQFELKYISHGSHSFDFFKACGLDPAKLLQSKHKEKDWIDTPVLFLMENPGSDNGSYAETTDNEKRPTTEWYWIHSSSEKNYIAGHYYDDYYLSQKSYGNMVLSLIMHYNLANAYLTNAVKCGMTPNNSNTKETYLDTSYYSNDCIDKCMSNILRNEITSLCGNTYDKIFVFAFGNHTYSLAEDFFENTELRNKKNTIISYSLALFPHPSNHSINNTFRKHILKGIMNETIYKLTKPKTTDQPKFKLTGQSCFLSDNNILEIFKKNFETIADCFHIRESGKAYFKKNTANISITKKDSIFRSTRAWIERIYLYLDKSLLEPKENKAFYYDFNEEAYYMKASTTNDTWEKITPSDTQSDLILSYKNAIEQLL